MKNKKLEEEVNQYVKSERGDLNAIFLLGKLVAEVEKLERNLEVQDGSLQYWKDLYEDE